MMNEKTTSTTIHYCADCGALINEDSFCYEGIHYCDDCVVVCKECGEKIPREFSYLCADDGEYFCEDCCTEYLTYCERCGNWRYADCINLVVVSYRGATEYWCEDCCQYEASQCANCGDWYAYDLTTTVAGGSRVCEDCLSNDYRYCEECDEYVPADDYDYDAEMCRNCADENIIARYHGKRKDKKTGDCLPQWRGIWRGYGWELEIDRSAPDKQKERALVKELIAIAGDAVVFERDGSLDYGFEIISQPHTEEALNKMPIGAMLEACKRYGYTSHDNGKCGLHLHISREVFGTTWLEQTNNIAKMLLFYELYYDDIVKVSRRPLSNAMRWADEHNINTKKRALEYARADYHCGRYYAVNLENMYTKQTVEVRIMRGTLNLDTFKACIDFIIRVAKNAKRIKWRDVENVKLWLNGISDNTKRYINERDAFVGVL